MKGILNLSVILISFSAIEKAVFSFSITQGPAINKNCSESPFLIFLIELKIIVYFNFKFVFLL